MRWEGPHLGEGLGGDRAERWDGEGAEMLEHLAAPGESGWKEQ